VIGDFSLELGNFGEFSGDIPQEISEQRIEYLESEIKGLIEKKLGEENIFPADTEVKMDIDENNCISMIRADVVLGKERIYSKKRVKEILEELGIDCRVSIVG